MKCDPDWQLRERITAFRNEAGWSQEELAYRCQDIGWSGATMQKIQQIEKGPRRIKLDELIFLSEAFGNTGDWIIEGRGIRGRPVTITGTTARAVADAQLGDVS